MLPDMNRTKDAFLVTIASGFLITMAYFTANAIFDWNVLESKWSHSTPVIRCTLDSAQANLALMVVAPSLQSGLGLIESCKRNLIGTNLVPRDSNSSTHQCQFVRVTYFLYFNQTNRDALKDIAKASSKDVHVQTSTTAFPLCRETELRDFYGSKFTHFIAIAGQAKVTGPIDMAQVAITDRLAALHQAFPNLKKLKTFKQTKPEIISTIHYSSSFFGGSMVTFKEICNFSNSQNFHIKLNTYFRENQPSTIVFPKRQYESVNSGSWSLLKRFERLEDTLELPPVINKQDEAEYAEMLEIDDDFKQNELYVEAAENLAQTLRARYVAKIVSTANFKFITAWCKSVKVSRNCGGLGDRLRGLVQAFYIAVAVNRIFHIDVTRPNNMAEYFKLNDELYNVNKSTYDSAFLQARNHSDLVQAMNSQNLWFQSILKDPDFAKYLRRYSDMSIKSNRYEGIEYIFRNKKYIPRINNMTKRSVHGIVDFPIFISAAYRVVLSQLTPRLESVLNSTIISQVGWDRWLNSVKIGIQIRTENLAGFFVDKTTRVQPRDIVCFTEAVRSFVKDKINKSSLYFFNKTVVVFVTTDWPPAVDAVKQELGGFVRVIFHTNLTINHIDQTDEADWSAHAKTYLDWFLLTKMDFLFISRSGLGETASLASLKPTKRFIEQGPSEKGTACSFQTYNTFMPNVVQFGYRGIHSL